MLFKAICHTKLCKSEEDIRASDYSKSGRTDRGVSAAGNVFALKLTLSQKEEKDLVRRINSGLPTDIMVLGYSKVSDDFNARFNCVAREYRYFFFSDGLDIPKMQQAAKLFEGNQDFRNFCKMKPEYEVKGTVRKVFECSINYCDKMHTKDSQTQNSLHQQANGHSKSFATPKEIQMAYLKIRGTGFLWHQVRCILAMLKAVGRGACEADTISDMLSADSKYKVLYSMDDPEGLVLYNCEYENMNFSIGSDSSKGCLEKSFAKLLQKQQIEHRVLQSVFGSYEEDVLKSPLTVEKYELHKSFKRIKK